MGDEAFDAGMGGEAVLELLAAHRRATSSPSSCARR